LFAYIGTYSRNGSAGIYRIEFENGQARIVGETNAINPSWLTTDGRRLYSVRETEQGAVEAFAIKPNGSLERINEQPSGGSLPCHLALRGGKLYAANWGSGSFGIFNLREFDGALEPGDFISYVEINGAQPHAHQCAFTPDGEWLAVSDMGTDRIVFYPLESSALSPAPLKECGCDRCPHDTAPNNSPITGLTVNVPRGTGPRHMAFADDGAWYVVGENSCEVLVYQGYGSDASLIEQKPCAKRMGLATNYASSMRLSPDGGYALCAVRGENTLALFKRAPNGTLANTEIFDIPGDWPRDVVFTPDGRYILVACERSDEIIIYSAAEGKPALRQISRLAIPAPACISFI
jgi:6-phosphogluconolactonase